MLTQDQIRAMQKRRSVNSHGTYHDELFSSEIDELFDHIAAQDAAIALLRAEVRAWREIHKPGYAGIMECLDDWNEHHPLFAPMKAVDAANALEGP